MDDWKYRIGSDVWKNLIYKECEAVKIYKECEAGEEDTRRANLACVDRAPSDKFRNPFFCFRPLTPDAGEPYLRSYLVFQAGRLFLVGAANETVAILNGSDPNDLPHHIVLLAWEESHIQGLPVLYAHYPEEKKWLTIWTSSWIWEETLRGLSKQKDKEVCELISKLRTLPLLTPEEVEINLESEKKYSLRDKVVACERQMDIALALGVYLSMDYVPNSLPCLRASFRCNRSEISLDPPGAIDFEKVREGLGKVIHSFPTLQDEFSIRYRNRHVPDPPESREVKDKVPVDLMIINKPIGEVRFEFKSSPQDQGSVQSQDDIISEPAMTEEQAKAILSKTAVAILCGGLASKREKDLLDPGRRLNVFPEAEEGQPQKEKTYVLSILEWRLYQLYLWAKKYKVESLPILLMTSPDTEGIIQERVTRFKEMLKRRHYEEQPLEVSYLRQQLVPVVKEGEKCRLSPVELDDGGWILDARGLLDFLRLLCDWSSETPENKRRPLCFVMAYNNLGSLFNEQTLKTLVALEKSKKHLGIEMFSFDPHKLRSSGREDPRLDLMSYGVDGVSGLFKNRGYRHKIEKDYKTTIYSSHTWYVNLKEVKTIREN